jgi:hypothetical protein
MSGKVADAEFMKRMSEKPTISTLAKLGLDYEHSPQVKSERIKLKTQ